MMGDGNGESREKEGDDNRRCDGKLLGPCMVKFSPFVTPLSLLSFSDSRLIFCTLLVIAFQFGASDLLCSYSYSIPSLLACDLDFHRAPLWLGRFDYLECRVLYEIYLFMNLSLIAAKRANERECITLKMRFVFEQPMILD
jgi:hypothetical protein